VTDPTIKHAKQRPPKLSVICVDDEPLILKSLRHQLREIYPSSHIQMIQSSRIALDLIKDRAERGQPYALLIVDQLMPEMRGDELLRQVTQVSPQTYQVLLTGEIDSEAMGRIINHAKLFRFLSKPWTLEELSLVVCSALASFQRDQELSEQQEVNQQLAHQLRQAQKIELLSNLSSEISHDFNNLLNIVRLSAESLQADLDGVHTQVDQVLVGDLRAREHADRLFADSQSTLDDISMACQQAHKLTKQLLTLSKDSDELRVDFDLRLSVKSTTQLLQRLIPSQVALSTDLSETPLIIRGDENAMQQVMMNLVINARDAIADSGLIRVLVKGHTQLEEHRCLAGVLNAGEYAHLQVIDSGSGISETHLNEIFEPFFSSKGEGGTGLGLTIVYQVIVSSLGGAIDVVSDADTVFNLYIPCLDS
jgi:signal transduction histidine kinase